MTGREVRKGVGDAGLKNIGLISYWSQYGPSKLQYIVLYVN